MIDAPLVQLFNAFALPAAGAFSAAVDSSCVDADLVAIWLSYTQGGAGGAPTVRIGWLGLGDGNTPVNPGTILGTVENPVNVRIRQDVAVANPGASPFSAAWNIPVIGSARSIVIQVAESGAVGTPGTLSLWLGAR